MRKIWLFSLTVIHILFFIAGAANAVKKDPKDFVLTHAENFAEWELICGHFGDEAEQDCNLRYTNIYSPRPNFKAAIFFLETDGDRILFDMHYEPYSIHLFNSVTDGRDLSIPLSHCWAGRCEVNGYQLNSLVESLRQGRDLSTQVLDYGVISREISIPSQGFLEGYQAFVIEISKRNKGHLVQELESMTSSYLKRQLSFQGQQFAQAKEYCFH